MFAALTNSPATNINFNLPQGATISGTILAGGNALNGAHVEAEIVTFGENDNENWQSVASAAGWSGWKVHPDRSARHKLHR